jgi:hypothetical protein
LGGSPKEQDDAELVALFEACASARNNMAAHVPSRTSTDNSKSKAKDQFQFAFDFFATHKERPFWNDYYKHTGLCPYMAHVPSGRLNPGIPTLTTVDKMNNIGIVRPIARRPLALHQEQEEQESRDHTTERDTDTESGHQDQDTSIDMERTGEAFQTQLQLNRFNFKAINTDDSDSSEEDGNDSEQNIR